MFDSLYQTEDGRPIGLFSTFYVLPQARRAGVAKYSGKGRVLSGLLDLISVWFQLMFARKPMILFGIPGIIFMGTGLVIGLGALWVRLVQGVGFRPVLYLVMLLVTVGLICFIAGLLAEMIASVRDELASVRRRLP